MFRRRDRPGDGGQRRRPLTADGAEPVVDETPPEAPAPAPPTPDAPKIGNDRLGLIQSVCDLVCSQIGERVDLDDAVKQSRGKFSHIVGVVAGEVLGETGVQLEPIEQRYLVTMIMKEVASFVEEHGGDADDVPDLDEDPMVASLGLAVQSADENARRNSSAPKPAAKAQAGDDGDIISASKNSVEAAKKAIQPVLLERIDVTIATQLPRAELAEQINELVQEISDESKIQLNSLEQRNLVTSLINDMIGLGPLEPLLADRSVTDIMVNGPDSVYVERAGKLDLTDVTFIDNTHVLNVATRIVTAVGRRIDETTPLCDARLEDGSRVNVIIPPLAIDGPSISIRKFAAKKITLDVMEKQRNLSPAMANVLKIAGRCRLNIIISGGTGSGKTTTLNAISQLIEPGERIVTIEDAAELQLQQPHVVRLETRPANLEGKGEITMRDLLRNTLRMRPDRIILGEVRGAEVVDMLQAMNTGHDGSLCTIHANNPREGLTRLENMVGLAGVNLSPKAIRTQIVQAVDLIVQVSRMRDGVRRVTHITEVVGQEEDVILTQDLFTFKYEGEGDDNRLKGQYVSSGIRPHLMTKAEYFGLDRALLETMSWESAAA